jgi:hypothetical protein
VHLVGFYSILYFLSSKLSLQNRLFINNLKVFLIIKPTRCIDFSNLFLEWNSACFGQLLCPSSGVLRCTHSNGTCHTSLLTACEQDQDVTLLCVQWRTPDDGQSNCQKHAEFHSKNKFEKSMHLVGFIIRNLSRCTFTLTSKSKSTHLLDAKFAVIIECNYFLVS